MGKKSIVLDLIILAILILTYQLHRQGCDKWLILTCLVVSALEIVTIIGSISQYKVRPVLVLLISFWIVNCQLYLDLLVGFISPDYYVFESEILINQGVLLSAISFTSFAIGYKASADYAVKGNIGSNFNPSVYNALVVFQVVSFLWWISTLTSADFSGASYADSGAYDKGNSITGYAEVFWGTSQILSLSYFLKKGDVARSFFHFLFKMSKPVLITSALYILIRLMSGDRGGAIYTAILYFFVYLYKTRKKVNLIPFVVVIIVGAIIVSSIGLTRVGNLNLSWKERVTYSVSNKDAIMSQSICPYTVELANSVQCTHIALEQTELRGQPYIHGLFHLCYLIKFIPVLGNSITYNVLGLPSFLQSSSEYVTIASSGAFYNAGFGTSTIADDYLEFGLIGVIVGFFVIGIFFKKIDTCLLFSDIQKTSVSMIILVLALCYGALYIPRGIFFFFIRDWFYAIVVYSLINSFVTMKRS